MVSSENKSPSTVPAFGIVPYGRRFRDLGNASPGQSGFLKSASFKPYQYRNLKSRTYHDPPFRLISAVIGPDCVSSWNTCKTHDRCRSHTPDWYLLHASVPPLYEPPMIPSVRVCAGPRPLLLRWAEGAETEVISAVPRGLSADPGLSVRSRS